MNSIQFPNIFRGNSTNIVKDLNATKQNTLLLLYSEQGELFGDPYFGVKIKRYIYNQNDYILRDIIIDELYNKIALFLPQVKVERKDIHINQERAKLYCSFKGTNLIDFTTNMYNLVLYNGEEVEG